MARKISISVLLITFSILIFRCGRTQVANKITVSNKADYPIKDKAILVSRQMINVPKEELYPVLISHNGDTIPSQLDDVNGDQIWDELFFVTDIDAQSKADFELKWSKTALEYIPRTSVRFGKRTSVDIPVKPANTETLLANQLPATIGFQKYQTDGPSWENDKVGFRHYLDGRNSKDLFGKKVATISPENVGIDSKGAVEDNYHVMEYWGRDILSVGNSVGIGGFGLSINGQLQRLGVLAKDPINNIEKTSFRIFAEGPVRSIINFQYHNWEVANHKYFVSETTSIWPGMYAFQNTVEFRNLAGNEELVIGLVNISSEEPVSVLAENEKYVVLYTHDKQTYNKEWWLGLALIVPKSNYLYFSEAPEKGKLSNSFLAHLQLENETPVTYYAVGCWELSDERFIDKKYFVDYLSNLTNQLSAEVIITVR